jgi:C-terminal processing protease CtpA/Prc
MKLIYTILLFVTLSATLDIQAKMLKGSVDWEETGYIGIDYNFKYQTVTHVYRKSDAFKQGLQEGDKIIRVDDQEVLPYPNCDHICGTPGTVAHLVVFRAPCWWINFSIMREYADECLIDY